MDYHFVNKVNLTSFTRTSLFLLILFTAAFWNISTAQKVQLIELPEDHKVEVRFDNQLFTSYYYGENIKKPVLYPVITSGGTKVTRGFPLEPQAGERVDHPHHVGYWFNYGDVNGLDFWNNSDSIAPEKRNQYGTIKHKEILKVESGKNRGKLKVRAEWMTPDGTVLLEEVTEFTFIANGSERTIDRITTLKAKEDVLFKDNKEGMIAIRVTRFMEHPENKAIKMVDSNGNITDVPVLDNEGVNGMYYNSEGVTGGDCWGKRARWVNLYAENNSESISLVLIDHPSNVGYPTYWHARGYGLFAANTLGQKVFSNGEEELNFSLKKGESSTFKYRLLVNSGPRMTGEAIEKRFNEFSKH